MAESKSGRPAGSISPSIEWAVHALGAAVLVMTCVWTWYFREGVAWSPGPGQSAAMVFNAHPLLMMLAFVFLYSEAAILFRSQTRPKATSKAIHMAVQTAALVLGVAALVFTYKYKVLRKLPHFYSLHSWLGLSAIALFFLQWVSAFVTFWSPGGAPATRAKLLPIHAFAGVFLYVYMLATVTAGLQEKMQLLMTPHPGDVVVERWSYETVFVDVLTLLVYALGGVVIFSVTKTGRPAPKVDDVDSVVIEGAGARGSQASESESNGVRSPLLG